MARKSTKAGPPKFTGSERVVVLHGKEDFLRSEYMRQLREAIDQNTDAELDTLRFDGKDAALADVLDELRSVGLMGQHKLVVVDQAEGFVSTHRASLEKYAESPEDSATLVLRAETWRPGNLDKKIAKVGHVIKCDHVSAAMASRWAMKRCEARHGHKLAPAAANALVERLGCDLTRLDSELGKLAASAGDEPTIDVHHIEALGGHASDQQAWAVQEAMLSGDPRRAIAQLHELVELANQADVLVAYFVLDLMRKLALASVMMQQRVPAEQITKQMKVWGPRSRPFLAAAQKLGPSVAARFLDEAIALDRRAKSGFGKHLPSLERLCIRFAAALRGR